MASRHGAGRGTREADEVSDSHRQDRKRKREKHDKHEKHEKKEKEKDRGRKERERGKQDAEHGQRPHAGDQQSHMHEAREAKKQTPPGERNRGEPAEEVHQPQKAQSWREEVHDGVDDMRDFSDDEEATQRKLEESRRRRAAALAKAVTKEPGSADDKGGGDETAPVEAKTQSQAGGEEPRGNGSGGGAASPGAGATAAAGGPAGTGARPVAPPGEAAGDMFDLSAGAEKALKGGLRQSAAISLTGASGDDWDDSEGYYQAKVGEVLEGRYLVHETLAGRGVFSNVVKARDQRQEGQPLVAIKIIRSNDMMKKAAEKEIEILQTLNNADKGDRKHVIRLMETFYYRKHIFLVFECMSDDLRAALKKHTKNRGMTLSVVRVYTKQLLVGLRHLHRCNIVHADLKPDNILISEGNGVVKICDLGTAVELKDVTVSPYLMSRFYRPPEVILGCEYGVQVDVWALSCTLYEIFTGKTLLQGKTNNDQLKKIMDLKGKVPGKVIKKGAVWKQHFDENLDFKYEDTDKVTGDKVLRVLTDNTAKRDIKELVLERVGPEKRQSQEREDQRYVKGSLHFADLLDKMLALDPDKRLSADDALRTHHFVAEPGMPQPGGAADRRR